VCGKHKKIVDGLHTNGMAQRIAPADEVLFSICLQNPDCTGASMRRERETKLLAVLGEWYCHIKHFDVAQKH
jgi:hypothetical protein